MRKIHKILLVIVSLLILPMLVAAAYSDVSLVNQYDANGSLISGDGKFYEYNDANQLVKVRENDQTGKIIAEYVYDYSGQRVKKIENGVTTYYIGQHYETNVVAGKADNTSYFFADGERVAKKDSTGTYFFHPDHLGGVNAVTDSAKTVVARTSYLPFGEIRQGGQEKYSYTGKEKDKATDLYYFDARYNHPELRHFTQADSADADLSDPQDLNRYAYVGNNPLSFIDPDGHKKKSHSKKEEKKLAKQRAAANALKKANNKAEAKQRAAADYAKDHPASLAGGGGGLVSVMPPASASRVLGVCTSADENNKRYMQDSLIGFGTEIVKSGGGLVLNRIATGWYAEGIANGSSNLRTGALVAQDAGDLLTLAGIGATAYTEGSKNGANLDLSYEEAVGRTSVSVGVTAGLGAAGVWAGGGAAVAIGGGAIATGAAVIIPALIGYGGYKLYESVVGW